MPANGRWDLIRRLKVKDRSDTYVLIYFLIYSMKQSPSWEANRFSATQPEGLLAHSKCPPPVPMLSQLDSVHTPTYQLLKTNLNIILPSTPVSPKWSLSLTFPQSLVGFYENRYRSFFFVQSVTGILYLES